MCDPMPSKQNLAVADLHWLPESISDLLQLFQKSSCHLRSSDHCLLHDAGVRNVFGSSAFCHAAPTFWNSLPADLVLIILTICLYVVLNAASKRRLFRQTFIRDIVINDVRACDSFLTSTLASKSKATKCRRRHFVAVDGDKKSTATFCCRRLRRQSGRDFKLTYGASPCSCMIEWLIDVQTRKFLIIFPDVWRLRCQHRSRSNGNRRFQGNTGRCI